MRWSYALALVVVGCGSGSSAVEPVPVGHHDTGSPAATGELVVRLGGEYPDLNFPLTIRFPGGSARIADGGEHRVQVPASDTELTRVEIEGWRPVWIRVPVGGGARLSSHPCCGVTFDSNTYDDQLAVCAVDGACPAGTEQVPHALAADPVCQQRPRCVAESRVRAVQRGRGGPGALITESEVRYPIGADRGAAYQPADKNIADMFGFAIEGGGPDRQDVAMDAGFAYTIWLDGDQVVGVTRSAR